MPRGIMTISQAATYGPSEFHEDDDESFYLSSAAAPARRSYQPQPISALAGSQPRSHSAEGIRAARSASEPSEAHGAQEAIDARILRNPLHPYHPHRASQLFPLSKHSQFTLHTPLPSVSPFLPPFLAVQEALFLLPSINEIVKNTLERLEQAFAYNSVFFLKTILDLQVLYIPLEAEVPKEAVLDVQHVLEIAAILASRLTRKESDASSPSRELQLRCLISALTLIYRRGVKTVDDNRWSQLLMNITKRDAENEGGRIRGEEETLRRGEQEFLTRYACDLVRGLPSGRPKGKEVTQEAIHFIFAAGFINQIHDQPSRKVVDAVFAQITASPSNWHEEMRPIWEECVSCIALQHQATAEAPNEASQQADIITQKIIEKLRYQLEDFFGVCHAISRSEKPTTMEHMMLWDAQRFICGLLDVLAQMVAAFPRNFDMVEDAKAVALELVQTSDRKSFRYKAFEVIINSTIGIGEREYYAAMRDLDLEIEETARASNRARVDLLKAEKREAMEYLEKKTVLSTGAAESMQRRLQSTKPPQAYDEVILLQPQRSSALTLSTAGTWETTTNTDEDEGSVTPVHASPVSPHSKVVPVLGNHRNVSSRSPSPANSSQSGNSQSQSGASYSTEVPIAIELEGCSPRIPQQEPAELDSSEVGAGSEAGATSPSESGCGTLAFSVTSGTIPIELDSVEIVLDDAEAATLSSWNTFLSSEYSSCFSGSESPVLPAPRRSQHRRLPSSSSSKEDPDDAASYQEMSQFFSSGLSIFDDPIEDPYYLTGGALMSSSAAPGSVLSSALSDVSHGSVDTTVPRQSTIRRQSRVRNNRRTFSLQLDAAKANTRASLLAAQAPEAVFPDSPRHPLHTIGEPLRSPPFLSSHSAPRFVPLPPVNDVTLETFSPPIGPLPDYEQQPTEESYKLSAKESISVVLSAEARHAIFLQPQGFQVFLLPEQKPRWNWKLVEVLGSTKGRLGTKKKVKEAYLAIAAADRWVATVTAQRVMVHDLADELAVVFEDRLQGWECSCVDISARRIAVGLKKALKGEDIGMLRIYEKRDGLVTIDGEERPRGVKNSWELIQHINIPLDARQMQDAPGFVKLSRDGGFVSVATPKLGYYVTWNILPRAMRVMQISQLKRYQGPDSETLTSVTLFPDARHLLVTTYPVSNPNSALSGAYTESMYPSPAGAPTHRYIHQISSRTSYGCVSPHGSAAAFLSKNGNIWVVPVTYLEDDDNLTSLAFVKSHDKLGGNGLGEKKVEGKVGFDQTGERLVCVDKKGRVLTMAWPTKVTAPVPPLVEGRRGTWGAMGMERGGQAGGMGMGMDRGSLQFGMNSSMRDRGSWQARSWSHQGAQGAPGVPGGNQGGPGNPGNLGSLWERGSVDRGSMHPAFSREGGYNTERRGSAGTQGGMRPLEQRMAIDRQGSWPMHPHMHPLERSGTQATHSTHYTNATHASNGSYGSYGSHASYTIRGSLPGYGGTGMERSVSYGTQASWEQGRPVGQPYGEKSAGDGYW